MSFSSRTSAAQGRSNGCTDEGARESVRRWAECLHTMPAVLERLADEFPRDGQQFREQTTKWPRAAGAARLPAHGRCFARTSGTSSAVRTEASRRVLPCPYGADIRLPPRVRVDPSADSLIACLTQCGSPAMAAHRGGELAHSSWPRRRVQPRLGGIVAAAPHSSARRARHPHAVDCRARSKPIFRPFGL